MVPGCAPTRRAAIAGNSSARSLRDGFMHGSIQQRADVGAVATIQAMPSVQRVRWAKFRVSSVAVVAVIILATLMYLLTGGTLLEPKARIYLYIDDATGLGPQSPVRVDGISIGTVDWVGF